MKRILLDTHTMVWLAAGVNLGPKSLQYIEKADEVMVSALSVFEIRLKHAKGKFPEAESIISNLTTMGVDVLDLTETHTKEFKIFSPSNKDPFDNALVGIALVDSVALMTADQKLLELDNPGLVTIDAKT
jgi:PIN domain nuclease of toxin-antitoxin system